MSDDEVLARLAEIAATNLDRPGPLRREMRLVEDLELDSIRLLTLSIEVEDSFRVCLDEDDEAGVATVGDLVAVVQRKLATPSA
jgi:acyl carrier protein